jgi:tRNA A-37 threonylcarbamoyl transferase component Bud32
MAVVSGTATGREGGMRCCPTCRAVYRSGFHRCPTDGTELAPFEADPVIGTTINGLYEVEACVGEGAMARVYRAHHLRLQQRRVALKILLGDLAASVAMRIRFTQEAKAASVLSHPNVVPVLDFGKTDQGLLYLVMEYVEGISLARIIADEAPLDSDRVVELTRQMCLGLAHAHAQGLIHRDFKPDNVLVVEGADGEVPRIADFGLAIFSDGDRDTARLTTAGTVVGTPLYTAPEQLLDRPVDHRADLFALGVTMYEMLAGQPPFDDGNLVEVLHHNLASPRPRIAQRAPGVEVDPALERIVHELLSADRDNRYATAYAVVEALDRVGQGAPRTGATRSRSTLVTVRPAFRASRTRRRVALGAAILAASAAAFLLLFWPGGPAGVAPERSEPAARFPAVETSSSGEGSEARPEWVATIAEPETIPAARATALRATPASRSKVDPATGAAQRAPMRPRAEPRAAGRGPGPSNPPAADLRAPGPRPSPRARTIKVPPAPAASAIAGSAAIRPSVPASVVPPRAPSRAPAIDLTTSVPVDPAPAETAAPVPRKTAPRPHIPALAARAAIGSLAVDGSLADVEIRRALERVRPRLAGCYRTAARVAGRDAAGGVQVSFEVDENGRASGIHAGHAPLPGLSECVSGAVSAVRSRIAPDVGRVRVSFLVSFTPLDGK